MVKNEVEYYAAVNVTIGFFLFSQDNKSNVLYLIVLH